MRDVLVLGSTGSIGTQALDVIARNPDRFRVVGLAAGGADVGLLADQATTTGAPLVAVPPAEAAAQLADKLADSAGARTEVLSGPDAVVELIERSRADVVLNGDHRVARPARRRWPRCAPGARLALANKESLVAGGPLVTRQRPRRARSSRSTPSTPRWPSACAAGARDEVRRLVLTASGGPFRGRRREELAAVTPEQALAHPTWDMGPVVTINSRDPGEQGLEVIEAHELFGVPYDDIEVVVHPQSVMHSMVRVHRRLDDRPGQPARHAAADRARAGLAGPGARRRPAPCDWTTAARPGPSSRWTTRRSPRSSSPRRPARPGGCRAGDLQRGQRGVRGGLPRPALPFLGIVDTVARGRARRPRRTSREPGTVEDVLAAEAWARSTCSGELIAARQSGEGPDASLWGSCCSRSAS